jgi:hypothetical protein
LRGEAEMMVMEEEQSEMRKNIDQPVRLDVKGNISIRLVKPLEVFIGCV